MKTKTSSSWSRKDVFILALVIGITYLLWDTIIPALLGMCYLLYLLYLYLSDGLEQAENKELNKKN